MPQDTTVKQLIVNQLSKEQYKQAKLDNMLSDTEIYIITDDYHYTESEIQTLLATKQDKLTTSGKINIDENNVISVDLSDYDSTLGSSLEYENSVLTLVSKDGKVLSNVTIKSTPDVDDTTIHLNNNEQLEVIGNITKDGTTKYDWICTKEEYEQGLTSGLITSTTTCFITDDEQDLITGGDILIPTKLSQFANDTNFVNSEILNNSIATKVDKIEGKSLIDDTEIVRLSGVNNYNDTEIKQILNNKVDKINGKSLIDDTEIVRLSGINNYDDTSIVNNITSLQLNKSNTSLNNLTPEGEKHFLNYSQVTNCITEIPQDMKLELNEGVLTLKAGSRVYMPNGFEADGTTPKFDEVVVESDKQWNYGTGEFVILISNTGGITGTKLEHTYSGTSSPTIVAGVVWYDTTNNIIKRSQAGTDWEEKNYALPISVVRTSSGSVTSIDQTFNGFGYIGSTVFVTKGVKYLVPNGRSKDKTLNNLEITTQKISTGTITGNQTGTYSYVLGSNQNIYYGSGWYYDEETNYNKTSDGAIASVLFQNPKLVLNAGKITSLEIKLPFRAVDYSDSSTVSGLGMPSNKYIDLTLGASESTYTAPANGWYVVSKTSTASGQYMNMINTTNNISIETNATASGNWTRCYLPVKKGDNITIAYSVAGTTNYFRFIYAEGEV